MIIVAQTMKGFLHRVTIERTSLSKETYTVKQPRKIFPSCVVFKGVDGRNVFEELSPDHSTLQVTRWEYFSGVFDCISFLT